MIKVTGRSFRCQTLGGRCLTFPSGAEAQGWRGADVPAGWGRERRRLRTEHRCERFQDAQKETQRRRPDAGLRPVLARERVRAPRVFG